MFAIGMVPVSPLSYNLCSGSRQRFPSIAVRKALSSPVRSLRLGHVKHNRGDIPLFLIPSSPNLTLHRFVHLGLSTRYSSNISFPRLKVVSNSNEDETASKDDEEIDDSASTHGKKVYTEYSVIGIPGDGRCLFRSVAHGACIRLGNPPPDENLQRKLADELREQVADEFLRRRAETEWFIEGDFDQYVSNIRNWHFWGGEPELLMASHVLKMGITVYMQKIEDSNGLISIAEYGEEYGRENPIRVLYHGHGHYDALLFPANKPPRSRL